MAARVRLRTAGFESIEATNGEDGVRLARDAHPDAILLDVRMDRMDGLEALERLQRSESTRSIPVVMLSASLRDKDEALDRGARFFLNKPYRGAELVSTLEAALAANG